MLSFSIPRLTADRLVRLGLACDAGLTATAHIGVRVGPGQVRFSATNGRLLASLLVPVDDLHGAPSDLVLDQALLTAALKTASKTSGGRIAFKIDAVEARVTSGTISSVVRRVADIYPNVDHVWSRPQGRRWIPTLSSLDGGLVAVAQRITGSKTPLLFASPVESGAGLERLWAVPGAKPDESIALSALRAAITAPAYWCDHELAILLMPITRGEGGRPLDLNAHAMPAPLVAVAA